MPGKLHVDLQAQGIQAFKPADAHAYCEGARSFQKGDNPGATPPPGLTAPALDLWAEGYADAANGNPNPACGLPALGPELVPDPLFRTWVGNPPTAEGWSQVAFDANNIWTQGAGGQGAHLESDAVAASTPAMVIPSFMTPGQKAQIQWKYATRATGFIHSLGTWIELVLDGDPGELRTATADVIGVQTTLSEGNAPQVVDAALAYYSVKLIFG